MDITFITGNQNKADYLARYIGVPIAHQKIDLEEIQSLKLSEVIEHKTRLAYQQVQKPIIVEDTSLEFTALGKLPGTLMKFFMQELSLEELCRLLDNKDRSATARCMYAYYDGTNFHIFEGSLAGSIAHTPNGSNGFGWDKIFIPNGFTATRAQLTDKDYETTYRQIKPLDQVAKYLQSINK